MTVFRVGIGATSSTKKVNRTELIVRGGRLDFIKKYCFFKLSKYVIKNPKSDSLLEHPLKVSLF